MNRRSNSADESAHSTWRTPQKTLHKLLRGLGTFVVEPSHVTWLAALLIAMNPSDARCSKPDDQQWSPKRAPLMTRWAKDVSPENVHPEYPRPQMVRKEWMNLNGLWELEIWTGSATPIKTNILVPFPVESALSGVMRAVSPSDTLGYRRTFSVPPGWKGKRVLLHFGAVDWSTHVLVNGQGVGTHMGGYDRATFDITDALSPSGEQVLEVKVTDPTDQGTQPRGKQVLKPEGIWYTPTSGIWQTVWLEPVPEAYITELRAEVNDKCTEVTIRPQFSGPIGGKWLFVELLDGNVRVGGSSFSPEVHPKIGLSKPKLWAPDNPHLYRVRLFVHEYVPKGAPQIVVDQVDSYIGLRSMTLGKDKRGRTRIFLNGKQTFLVGPLDQGFWPDGLYTAPTDAALKYDIEVTKRLGFNFIRKHVKVEPDRFYYWCDKMGLLVFQDMPSGDKYIGGRDPDIVRTKESGEQFERELTAMIESLRNHPSIVGWVPYNEGWGQWDTPRITDLVKELDPSRLVVSASGWTDRGTGDLVDWHVYPGPGAPKPEANRASFLGEFGGLGLPMPGHMWQKEGWGYRSFKTQAELSDGIVALFQNLRSLIDDPGLSGAVYTQTTDVEQEVNGLMTYDRAIIKPDAAKLREAVDALSRPPPRIDVIVPTSEKEPQHWAYRTDPPDPNWMNAAYDDSLWKRGPGGFGSEGTPGAVIGTAWNASDIWLRRVVQIPRGPTESPHLRIHHDEDAEVYLDGRLLAKLTGYTTGYVLVPLPAKVAARLTAGPHTLAVHCRQTGGGQFVDVGLVDVVEVRAGKRPR